MKQKYLPTTLRIEGTTSQSQMVIHATPQGRPGGCWCNCKPTTHRQGVAACQGRILLGRRVQTVLARQEEFLLGWLVQPVPVRRGGILLGKQVQSVLVRQGGNLLTLTLPALTGETGQFKQCSNSRV
jgi:hypothetical protein